MANPLLDRALPGDLADRSQVFDIKGKISEFPRLLEIVASELERLPAAARPRAWRATPVAIRLEFAWADGRREIPAVEGDLAAELAAVCQRCLEPFVLPISARVKMLLMSDAAASQREGFEVWELQEETIRPLDIVEEALIMAMPLATVHGSSDDCGALADTIAGDEASTTRPFKDLRSRMEKTG